MKRRVRFRVDLPDFVFGGRGITDPESADPEGFLKIEAVEFDSPEDAEEWREYDRACGGDGTGMVIAHRDEITPE